MELEKVRRSFRPSSVKVLFVGESAPAGGTFFYLGNSNLERYTQEGFEIAYGIKIDSAKVFLNKFMNNGFYLDDLCLTPVNHMIDVDRKRARTEAISDFALRLKDIKPKVVVTIIGSIKKQIDKAIIEAGMNGIPHYQLPFPAMSHQQRYVRELSGILQELHKAKIINGTF